VGLINSGESPFTASVNFSDIGYSNHVRVRDLWERKDLGEFRNSYTTMVPKHGVVLIEIH